MELLSLKAFLCPIAIEKELEKAIYKAGGIRDSNFGDLQKIAWATSNQIDDEVKVEKNIYLMFTHLHFIL